MKERWESVVNSTTPAWQVARALIDFWDAA
jgi:hypothetical protein